MTTLDVQLRGINKRFASINGAELAMQLYQAIPNWKLEYKTQDCSHLKVTQKFNGGSRTVIRLRSEQPVMLHNGDIVYPYIRIIDQDFSGAALRIEYGLYRQICSNGLFGFRSVSDPVRIPHFTNRADILSRLVQIVRDSTAEFKHILIECEKLSAIKIQAKQLVPLLDSMQFPKRLRQKIDNAITVNAIRPEDDITNVWGLYNFINEIDRTNARRNSIAYIQRDNEMIINILKAVA